MLRHKSNLAAGFSSDKCQLMLVSTLTLHGDVAPRRAWCETKLKGNHCPAWELKGLTQYYNKCIVCLCLFMEVVKGIVGIVVFVRVRVIFRFGAMGFWADHMTKDGS